MRVLRMCLLAGLISTSNRAQLTVSTLRGTITDPAGAVVVHAKITALNQETNLTREVFTNGNGDYEIPDLQRGTYRLTATQDGFKTFVADNVVLESSQIRRIDAALEIGSTGTEVTVRGDMAVIATETGKIQETFQKQRFEELPLVGDGRTPDAVLVSLPMIQNAGGVYSIQMAGQPTSQIQMAQDGHTNDGSTNQINRRALLTSVGENRWVSSTVRCRSGRVRVRRATVWSARSPQRRPGGRDSACQGRQVARGQIGQLADRRTGASTFAVARSRSASRRARGTDFRSLAAA